MKNFFHYAQKNTNSPNFKYIVFNKIVDCVNNLNNTENIILARKIIQRYRAVFFEVPESIMVYFHLTSKQNTLVIKNLFNDVLYYLNKNQERLLDFQIQKIALKTFQMVFDNSQIEDFCILARRIKAIRKYNKNLLAYNIFELFCFFINHQKRYNKNITYLLNTKNLDKLKVHLKIIIKPLQILENRSILFDPDRDNKEYYLNTVNRYVKWLSKEFTVHGKSKIVLDFYLQLNEHLYSLFLGKNKFATKKEFENYLNMYLKNIQFFEENKKLKSDYMTDFKRMEFLKDAMEINEVIKNKRKIKFQNIYFKTLKNQKEEYLFDFLNEIFLKNRNNQEFATFLFLILKTHVDRCENFEQNKLEQILNTFFESYEDDVFFENPLFFLNYIMVNFEKIKYRRLIYNIFETLTVNINNVISDGIDKLIINFLHFLIKTLRHNPDFHFNLKKTNELITILKKELDKKSNMELEKNFLKFKYIFGGKEIKIKTKNTYKKNDKNLKLF